MPAITRERAAKLARKLPPGLTYEEARDEIDLLTGGDLDATQLDLLTDWTIEALGAAVVEGGTP